MGKQDALYLLVKSLTPGEKSLVRQSDNGKSGYMSLFDLIARQRQYDERKLKKKLKETAPSINFSYAKNYLTRHILRCLREARSNADLQVSRQVIEAEMLMERKVFGLADKVIAKALVRALEEERFEDYQRLSALQIQRILQGDGKVEKSIEDIRAINQQRAEVRKQQDNLGEYEDLFFAYQPVSKRKRSARNQADLEMVKAFQQDPLLKNPKAPLSRRAQRLYFKCKTHILAYTGELKGVLSELEAALKLYRESSFLKTDYPVDFLTDMARLGGLKLELGAPDACLQLLNEIRAVRDEQSVHGSESYDKYFRLLLAYVLETRSYGVLEEQMEEVVSGLEEYAEGLPWTSLSMIYFMLGRYHFEVGQYGDTRKWLDHVLDRTNRGIREDITSVARILKLFTYFEEGDLEFVESQSRATRKFLSRREQLYGFERSILRFLEKDAFRPGAGGQQQALVDLKAELKGVFANPYEAVVLRYFDIMGWLESKIAQFS